MSFNLIESVKALFSGDMTNNLAGSLGESSGRVQQAMQGVIASVLTGVLLKADSGDVQDTLNLATDAVRMDIPLQVNVVSGNDGSSKGMDFLKGLNKKKTAVLSESIGEYAGISSSSATYLLSIVAPAALGVLGNHILDTNMNASGLRSFLNSQKKKIFNAMPAGVFMEGIMGFENFTGIAEKFSIVDNPVLQEKRASKWVLPVILGLIALGAVWYYMNRQQSSTASTVAPIDTAVSPKDTTPVAAEPENPLSVKLPDGTILTAKKGGIEDQLLLFFNDPESRPSRRFPYNFDQLNFNSGSATITNESMVQIQNVALILKAFPKARVKIGGFNEKGGDSIAKKALSDLRAVSVAAAIKSAGANANQLVGVEVLVPILQHSPMQPIP
jgi:outer membrane protein OmpA-like peptidoglycan-associated protein